MEKSWELVTSVKNMTFQTEETFPGKSFLTSLNDFTDASQDSGLPCVHVIRCHAGLP